MGKHQFPLRDIALQAGLSLATVDRVLNGRPGVRANTVREVQRAIAELERQASQVRLVGRRYVVDVVMQSPPRFQSAVQAAVDRAAQGLYPAQVRVRYHLDAKASAADIVGTLAAVRRTGSHGVILKAPDTPGIRDAVAQLAAVEVPVVTLVTDVASTQRLAYIGMDNEAAGATAALLIAKVLADEPGRVLVTRSSGLFLGEEERLDGFRAALRASQPHRVITEIARGDGLDEGIQAHVRRRLRQARDVAAVYSIGGGNRAILAACETSGVTPLVYVAHDLDADNRELLAAGAIDFVLHHDLNADAAKALRVLLAPGGADRGQGLSAVQVVTAANIP